MLKNIVKERKNKKTKSPMNIEIPRHIDMKHPPDLNFYLRKIILILNFIEII